MDGHRSVESRRWLVGLGVAVAFVFAWNARSLSFGWFGDDYVHRRILLHLSDSTSARPWWNLFDDRQAAGASVDDPVTLFGRLPWWTSPNFSFALFRPLSAASHALDYLLWPSSPWAMHLHNLVLFALIVCVACALYRRWLGDPLAAWLALGAYAIDDAHTVGNAWIASRNTLLVTLFGLVTLWLFDLARRDRVRWAAWLAPVALLCAHASSEGATALWAYFLAYALFLDPAGGRSRFFALLPLAAVSGGFYVLGAAYGYGVRGSGLYVDPRTEPLRFASVALQRLPDIVATQFGASIAAFEGLPLKAVVPALWLALAWVALALLFGVWSSRRTPATRFFLLAAALSLLPHCTVGAAVRLLYISGFAAHGVIGIALASCIHRARAARHAQRAAFTLLAAGLLLVHGVSALLAPARVIAFSLEVQRRVERAARSLPQGEALRDHRILVLSYPDYLTSVFVGHYRRELAMPGPRAMYVLGTGPGPVRIRRLDVNSLELSPEGGYFRDPSMWMVRPPGERFERSQFLPLGAAAAVRVDAVTADGRPERISVLANLADPRWLWVAFDGKQGRFVPIPLPAVGQQRQLPSSVE